MSVTRAAGLRLARNIPATDPRQMPLLRSGAIVSERYRAALTELGIRAVWVQDELSEGIEPVDLVSEDVRQEAARTVSDTFVDARGAFDGGQELGPAVLADLHHIVDMIAGGVAAHPGASIVL